MMFNNALLCPFDFVTVVPATELSASKEAMVPNQINRHISEANIRLLNQARAEANNDVVDVSLATV